MSFKHYINGQQVSEPEGWKEIKPEVIRDFDKRMLYVRYPTSVTFTTDGYRILRNLFEANYCTIAEYLVYERCGSFDVLVMRSNIILSDGEWNLNKCTVECSPVDDGLGARVLNNLSIPIVSTSNLSKNAVSIAPSATLAVEVFDPADTQADYLATPRNMFDWLDAIRHALEYVTDGTVTLVSQWYNSLPQDERIAIVNGFQLRTGSTNDIDIRVRYNLKDLFEEVAKRYNLWMILRRDPAGLPIIAIEPERDTYGANLITYTAQDDLIQTFDSDRLYAKVMVGCEDGLPNLGLVESLPYIVLQGFSEEEFHFEGVCNTDTALDLVGKWVDCTNVIERVVVLDPTSENYDKDTFIVQYDATTLQATKGDYLVPGSNPYLYNEQLLNINKLERYNLPGNVGLYLDPSTANFRAQNTAGATFGNLIALGGTNSITSYDLPGVATFADDTTPPNNDPGGNWDTTLYRYTAPSQGYYVFQMQYFYTVINRSITTTPLTIPRIRGRVEFQRYDATNVLIQSVNVASDFVEFNTVPITASAGLVLNPGDYVQVRFWFDVTKDGPSNVFIQPVLQTGYNLRTTFVATGGGVLTNIDPRDAKVVNYRFTRSLNANQWRALAFDPTLGVTVNGKRCHVGSGQRTLEGGSTEWTLITDLRNL